MSTPSRHLSLTRQLVLPVVGLVLAAVLANVGFSAWLAARRSAEATRAAQQQVADALRASRVSLSAAVLDALHRLTGSHFLTWEESTRRIGLSTLPPEAIETVPGDAVAAAIRAGSGTFGGQRYRLGTVRSEGVRPETVLVLTPERSFIARTFDAVWPVLAVAAGTLAVLVPLGLRTTGRLASRITAVVDEGPAARRSSSSSLRTSAAVCRCGYVRAAGVRAATAAAMDASRRGEKMGVATAPGRTTDTDTPSGPTSRRSESASASTANLEAA